MGTNGFRRENESKWLVCRIGRPGLDNMMVMNGGEAAQCVNKKTNSAIKIAIAWIATVCGIYIAGIILTSTYLTFLMILRDVAVTGVSVSAPVEYLKMLIAFIVMAAIAGLVPTVCYGTIVTGMAWRMMRCDHTRRLYATAAAVAAICFFGIISFSPRAITDIRYFAQSYPDVNRPLLRFDEVPLLAICIFVGILGTWICRKRLSGSTGPALNTE